MTVRHKEWFTYRADYHDKYRPSYTRDILHFLERDLAFSSASVVADIGSGTGILSELFLENGNLVYAVEPNEDMRGVAEAKLSGYGNFRSVEGSAESSTVANAGVDFVTAAQAFHWFDPPRAREEFRRILRRDGSF